MTKTLLTISTILMGLSAGLFATFSYAVMPGLRRTDDHTFVASMRAINVAILNPVFAIVLGGAFVVAAAALVVGWSSPSRTWLLAGLVLYVVGAFVVTGAVNVPMNDALEAGKGTAAALRETYEGRWVAFNHVRSMLTTAGFACLVIGTLKA